MIGRESKGCVFPGTLIAGAPRYGSLPGEGYDQNGISGKFQISVSRVGWVGLVGLPYHRRGRTEPIGLDLSAKAVLNLELACP